VFSLNDGINPEAKEILAKQDDLEREYKEIKSF
jgi:hypothetical protein